METKGNAPKLLWGFIGVLVAVLLGFWIIEPQYNAIAASPSYLPLAGETDDEVPTELTEEEMARQTEQLYARYEAGFIVTLDLKDPNGINPELLPEDVASMVHNGTTVVAFREAVRVETPGSSSLDALFCEAGSFLGITCRTGPDSTQDLTISVYFGGMRQFNRVYALKYNNYSGCSPNACAGWEFEQQWSKWTRSASTWTLGASSAQMKTTSTIPENFCTGAAVSLNFSSTPFTPTFTNNATNWWSLTGYQNIAYVPGPTTAKSYTVSDIYYLGDVYKYDAETAQYHNKLQ